MKTIRTLLFSLFSLTALLAYSDANEDLFNACKQGDFVSVQKAVDGGADVNQPDANGYTAIATAYLWPEITKYLLDKGADPNGGVYPAIISAANNYSLEVMQLLLDAGADPNKGGKLDPGAGLRDLIEKEKAKGKEANDALIKAWEGALSTLKPSEVFAVNQSVQQTNCAKCLKLLVDKGADIKKTDPTYGGNLAHTLAVFGMTREGRKEAFAKGVEGMATYGYKVPEWYGNLPDDLNGTSADMMQVLIDGGIDIHLIDNNGNNPLLASLGTNKLQVSKALVEAGADVNYMNPTHKKDAVSFAAEWGDLELLKMLVEKGADITNETWDLDTETKTYCKGFTALSRAVIYDHYDCAKYLVDNGAEIKEGISGYFVQKMYTKNGKVMMDFSGPIPKPLVCRYKLKNKTPVYFAIENQNMEMIELLATSYKWYGNHSMEMAAQGGNKEQKAVCNGQAGKFTPSRYAKDLGYKDIQKYLESLGK